MNDIVVIYRGLLCLMCERDILYLKLLDKSNGLFKAISLGFECRPPENEWILDVTDEMLKEIMKNIDKGADIYERYNK